MCNHVRWRHDDRAKRPQSGKSFELSLRLQPALASAIRWMQSSLT